MKKLIVLFVLFSLPFFVSAHGSGISFETEVGMHAIDIGYSTKEPIVGEVVIFDFSLPDKEVQYSDVWVRVTSEEGNVVLATGVHNAVFGGPRLSYAFPEVGTYVIDVRYENESETVIETSFPITIAATENTSSKDNTLIALFGGFVIGVLGAFLIRTRKSV